MSVLSDLLSGQSVGAKNALDRTMATFNPSTPTGSALASLASSLNESRDRDFMGKVFAANPQFATQLFSAQQGQQQLANQSRMTGLEEEKLKGSALSELKKQQQEAERQSALAELTKQLSGGGSIEQFLGGAAQYDPRYAGSLIDYKVSQEKMKAEQEKAKQPNWQVKEVNGQLVSYDANNPVAGATPITGGGQTLPDVKGETDLRKEFDNLNKDYRIISDSYNKIKKVEQSPSAAGDLSLIFSYMKLLDPASTVREGEFATAQNAAGIPTQIQNIWNKAQSGERLAPEQRADFLNQAKNLYQAQSQSYSSGVEKYRGLAKDYGYNPDRIVKPITEGSLKQEQPTQTKTIGGVTYVNRGGKWFKQ
jgi:hypothetical protein